MLPKKSLWSCAACLRTPIVGLEYGQARVLSSGSIVFPRRFLSTRPIDTPRELKELPTTPSIAQKRAAERLGNIVDQQMRYLRDKDPYKIGQYVEQALRRNAFDEALLLVQKVGRGQQVVVAWNLLIDYQFGKQKIKEAMKLFNDMKKRGQQPNSRTYTVIFRGLSKQTNTKLAVSEAVKQYNSLIKGDRVESNSIHLNAAINVCAKAGDMDALFRIVDTINESSRTPDALTYTTILNALRFSTMDEIKDAEPEKKAESLQKLVSGGKDIWAEVIDKWSDGALKIDEELVCAMGRLLHMALPRDSTNEVLDLLAQTMRIPNLVKNPSSDAHQDEKMRNIAATGSSKPVHATPHAAYAVPGRKTLSLVLTVLASTRQNTAGIKYWNLLVRHYGIEPDNDIWFRLLGLLKVAKASAHASNTLELIPEQIFNPRHCRIAMEACVRDNINLNVIKNSTVALETMLKKLKIPDVETLRLHLRVALVSHFRFRKMAAADKLDEAKRLYGVQLTEVLNRLWGPYQKVHRHFFEVIKPKDKDREASVLETQNEIIALARQMFSVFNKVVNEKMLPNDDLEEMRLIASKLNRDIQDFFSKHGTSLARTSPVVGESADGTGEDKASGQDKQGADFIWDTTKSTEFKQQQELKQSAPAYRRESPRSQETSRRSFRGRNGR
uniref:Pentacotripeptide-repeat region of PRORP domain-containing protein n=1 Tax=Bionectria ochroleuca TaxID=29856 RepID=A0A8H7K2Y8_BIOOC